MKYKNTAKKNTKIRKKANEKKENFEENKQKKKIEENQFYI